MPLSSATLSSDVDSDPARARAAELEKEENAIRFKAQMRQGIKLRPRHPPHLPSHPSKRTSAPPATDSSLQLLLNLSLPASSASSRPGLSTPRSLNSLEEEQDAYFCSWAINKNIFITDSTASSASSLELLLRQVGGLPLVNSFREKRRRCIAIGKGAEIVGESEKFGLGVVDREDVKTRRSKRAEKCWLEAVADQATNIGGSISNHRWQSDETVLDKTSERVPDASLRDATATSPSWTNILVPVEATTSKLPTLTYTEEEQPDRDACATLRRAIMNGVDLLIGPQESRIFALSLAFFGAGDKSDAILIIIDHEVVRLHVLYDVADAQFATFAALLATLREANIYQLGFSPLFTYKIHTTAPFSIPSSCLLHPSHKTHFESTYFTEPSGRSPGDIFPITFNLPDPHLVNSTTHFDAYLIPLLLIGPPLSCPPETPFSRSTLVYRALAHKRDDNVDYIIIKIQYVSEVRGWREATILERLWGAKLIDSTSPDAPPYDTDSNTSLDLPAPSSIESEHIPIPSKANISAYPPSSPPTYAPTLIATLASSPLSSHSPLAPHSRNLEVILTHTPSLSGALCHVPPDKLLSSMLDAIDALAHAHSRGVMHGDISIGNLFSVDGKIILIDWECGKLFGDGELAGVRYGTRETMAIGYLLGRPYVPSFDIESLLLCFLQIVTISVVIPESNAKKWSKAGKALRWGEPFGVVSEEIQLATDRASLWGEGEAMKEIVGILEGSHRSLAELLSSIAKLDVPKWSDSGADDDLNGGGQDGVVKEEQWEELRTVFRVAKPFSWEGCDEEL